MKDHDAEILRTKIYSIKDGIAWNDSGIIVGTVNSIESESSDKPKVNGNRWTNLEL